MYRSLGWDYCSLDLSMCILYNITIKLVNRSTRILEIDSFLDRRREYIHTNKYSILKHVIQNQHRSKQIDNSTSRNNSKQNEEKLATKQLLLFTCTILLDGAGAGCGWVLMNHGGRCRWDTDTPDGYQRWQAVLHSPLAAGHNEPAVPRFSCQIGASKTRKKGGAEQGGQGGGGGAPVHVQ